MNDLQSVLKLALHRLQVLPSLRHLLKHEQPVEHILLFFLWHLLILP